jgi:hypothetical protein
MSQYESDVLQWSEHQVAPLRARTAGEFVNGADLDWPNIAEEIEPLSKASARELANRLSTILIHLLNLQSSKATDPRIDGLETIMEQRGQIERVLRDAPSLRRSVAACINEEIDGTRRRASAALADHGEQPRADIAALKFTEEHVLGVWFPS